MSVIKRNIKKGFSNNKYPTKEYWYLAHDKEKGFEPSIIIKRIILIDHSDEIPYLKAGYVPIKTFKGKALCFKSFSVKVSTLKEMIKWVKL